MHAMRANLLCCLDHQELVAMIAPAAKCLLRVHLNARNVLQVNMLHLIAANASSASQANSVTMLMVPIVVLCVLPVGLVLDLLLLNAVAVSQALSLLILA
jgi:hypothetical protein